MITVSATTARAKLYDLLEEVSSSGKRVGITNKGETKAVLMSREDLDALMVTMETLMDKELMAAIRKGDEEIKRGKYVSLEAMEQELGFLKQDVSDKFIKSRPKRTKKIR